MYSQEFYEAEIAYRQDRFRAEVSESRRTRGRAGTSTSSSRLGRWAGQVRAWAQPHPARQATAQPHPAQPHSAQPQRAREPIAPQPTTATGSRAAAREVAGMRA